MKYTEEQYLKCQYWPPAEEETNYHSKIVKTRKAHMCAACGVLCTEGKKMFLEECIIPGEGRCTSYTCLDCLDKWIDTQPSLQG